MNKRSNDTTQKLSDAARTLISARKGFTLLEMLIVLVLVVVLLGGLAALIRVFTNSYYADERRVGRAQLARSISQMLEEDLGSAVQDPIQNVTEDANRQFIRHFGLRGDARSLQIDVVQPSLFASTATASENKRVLSGGDKSPASRQVPELKTIFYEFVPINAVEETESEQTDPNSSAAGTTDGADLGSTLSGSLSGATDPTAAAALGYDSLGGVNGLVDGTFLDGTKPLAQKFGLSRRELDYETPDEQENEQTVDAALGFGAQIDPETGAVDSTLAGSLTTPPDAQNSTLASTSPEVNAALGIVDESQVVYKEPLTAVQIAMDADDGYTWAPEVLDCRFSYFDGTDWQESWDSIQNKGLPVAIKVELKLAPIDDVDLYRNSPLFTLLPVAPSLDDISKFMSDDANVDASSVDVSRLAGSLTQTAQKKGEPIDVFNSYRPLAMIRAALEGVLTSQDTALFTQTASSATTENTADANSDSDAAGLGLIGSASGAGSAETSAMSGALGGSTDAAGSNPNADAMLKVQSMLAGGAVFNEMGVCVDFSNDGSYITLEQLASEIGVSEPIVYEVVVYLPTTPFSRATTVQRRVATTTRAGNVSTRQNRGNASSRDRRAQGQNPYATGRARRSQPRQRNERTRTERTSQERSRADRQSAQRNRADRQTADRNSGDRQFAERSRADRSGGGQRTANARTRTERLGRNGGWTDDNPPAGVDVSDSGGYGSRNGGRNGGNANAAEDPFAIPGLESSASNNSSSGLSGGLAGSGGAAQLGGLDPFEIVDQQNAATLPYASADSPFDDIGGVGTPGLIETPVGTDTVAAPTARNNRPQTQQQTWIRGKK